jgi:hypothetical protein
MKIHVSHRSLAALLSLGVLVGVASCGDSGHGGSTAEAPVTEDQLKVMVANLKGPVEFKGFVGGAFPITVDGVGYEDSEDFFTAEVSRLPQKVAAAGFDNTWLVTFEAALGFRDLRNDMMVYIAPMEKKGYQGEASVEPKGSFSVTLPKEAGDAYYQVRAVKRIAVVLTRESEVKRFCYNFSAVAKQVPLSEREKPIVLDTFVTKLTTYACSVENREGLVIPEGAPLLQSNGTLVTKVAKDDTRAEVATKWGDPDFVKFVDANSVVWNYKVTSRELADLISTGDYPAPAAAPAPVSCSWCATPTPTPAPASVDPTCKLTFKSGLLATFSIECQGRFVLSETF